MRRFPLLVLLTLVVASLTGFALPTRNAAAGLPPSCEQKRSSCLFNAQLNHLQCEIQQLGDCAARYEQERQICESNYRFCKAIGP
jgi:hypothetical protein